VPDEERSRSDHHVPPREPTPTCDLCGSPRTAWIKCKLICLDCRGIVMSCGDL